MYIRRRHLPSRPRAFRLLAMAGVATLAGAISVAVGTALAPAAQAATTVGDATATPGGNSCSWTMSTAAISKTVTFAGGSYTMTSLQNLLVSGGREYEQAGASSGEFQFSWDGTTYTGGSGGWTCSSGSSTTGTVGGQSVVLVTVVLTRPSVQVTMHYTVFPSESLIQQSTDYTNTDTVAHTLAAPSLVAQHVMQAATSTTDVNYMVGARAVAGSWTPQALALSTAGARTFDSYDPYGCTGWANIGSYSSSGYLGMQEWHDSSGGYVWPAAEHPGPANDTARTFVAPATGTVSITGTAAKMNTSGNGVIVRITANGRTVWGPTTIAGTDTTGVATNVSGLSVTHGDDIRFEIDNNGDWSYDATSWNPTISYAGGASYTASSGFSSTQGPTWYYQDYRGCTPSGFQASSTDYAPWFSLWNRNTSDGLYLGLSYHGRWATAVGNADGGAGDLTVTIPNYSSSLAAGATMQSPTAFVGTYVGDSDDMTNRLLDYQYRYLWDYTRPTWFAKVRMLGSWQAGAEAIPPTASTASYDPNGMLNQVVGLTERMSSIGADIYHRDYGWWTTPWGDWNGPDWKTTNDYLAKYGMKQLVYYPAYYASSGSTAYNSNPGLFPYAGGQGECYGGNLTDFTQPAAVTRMQNLLVSNAQAWGDYEWRNDTCWMQDATGATQLGQQRGFYTALQGFLDSRPNSAFQAVDDGGNETSWDYLRYASSLSFTDLSGRDQYQGASELFPMDKMSGIPDSWSPAGCNATYNVMLAWNPDFTGDTTDPTRLACMHTLVDTYHYLVAQGVAGRWARQYHPQATDANANWYERLSQDGTKGLLIYSGSGSTGSVTVYPKGLVAGTTYDVRTNGGTVLSSASGSTLMSSGITLGAVPTGTLIYLNLPNYPGSTTDTTPPTAPASLTATIGTNMTQQGVELSWPAATDDNWVDHYEVRRDGVQIATVATGTYFFDRSPAASTASTYSVRAVDGAGNTSRWVYSTPTGPGVTAIDDGAGAGLTYSGTWVHDTTSYPEAFDQTLSGSNTTGSYAEYSFTGNRVVLYGRPSPDGGNATISIDGTTDVTVNTFASTNLTYQVPLYAKTWPTSGTHTIRVTVAGTKDSRASNTYVVLDGLQISNAAVTTTEDSSPSVTYSGSGWQHSSSYPQASNSDISWDNQAGDSVSYTFTGSRIAWIAEPGANKGEADVSIDGTFVTRVDLYGLTGADWFRSTVFSKSWPGSGTHTITITVVGKHDIPSSDNYVTVDAFQTS